MQKQQGSQSGPSTLPLSMPDIKVQSASQNDLGAMGHNKDDVLDPNGNPVTGRTLCPPLKPSHSEPRQALTTDESDVHSLNSESDAPFR